MAESSAFPVIPVTAAEVIRQVGHGVYSRGQQYMRAGYVARYSFTEETRTLEGTVNGSNAAPYTTTVVFPEKRAGGSLAFSARCTCPVYVDCKHAVALMLTAIDRADKARKTLTASSATLRPSSNKTQRLTPQLRNRLQELGLSTASHLAAGTPQKPEPHPKLPAWQRKLSSTLESRTGYGGASSQRVSAALDLSFYVSPRYSLGQNDAVAQINLQARPLRVGARGNWIKGGLSWENFQQDYGRGSRFSHSIYPEHERWFAELYSVVRPWQSSYVSHRDWVSLSSVNSSLLWQVLREAEDIGLPLLIDGQEARVVIADPAEIQLRLDSEAEPNRADGLSISPVLSWGAARLPVTHCHRLGDPHTGFIALGSRGQATYVREARSARWEETRLSALNFVETDTGGSYGISGKPGWLDRTTDLLFIPLAAPLDPVAESLTRTGTISIPAGDCESFYRDFYPQLYRNFTLQAAHHSVKLPQVQSPQLVLTVAFDEDQPYTARTFWEWEYPLNPLAEAGTAHETLRLSASQYPGEDRPEIRDSTYEHRVLRAVNAVYPAVPFTRHVYEGWATRTLLEESLARYRRIPGVRVDLSGRVPEFRELENDPEITVSVESTADRDWFGLGIAVKVGEWYVPFAKIFEALNADKSHLLLGDGSYFALDRPEFMKLQELLREAKGLTEKSGSLQISRHQAGLWEELEELAADLETVEVWDRQVSALLTVKNGPVPDVPPSLRANLRPYQLEGYQWLSFLWEHELGGILADDMGLGKTVQVIALMAYAKETWQADKEQAGENSKAIEPFTPFLVVTPTSVLPNWVREIDRFAPHLTVKAVYESQRKTGQPLEATIAGADIVVTSYTLFRIDQDAYTAYDSGRPWNGLILDEAQFVKNAKTKAHRAARDIPARFKLAVTGTPMENNLMELWSMFSIVAPGLFPSARRFKDLYAAPIEGGEDKRALPRLRQRVRPLIKRRTKDLVAADLPEKNDTRIDVPLAPAHRRAYDTALQRERKKVLGLIEDMDKNRFTVFQSLTTLRRMALDPSLIDDDLYAGVESSKLDYLEQNLPEIIAEGHRTLIFSQFTSYLKKIAQRLDSLGISYLYLDGATRDRARVLSDFAEGDSPIFLISLKAGGFGLNLTEADYCFIMDPWWNPAAEQQAVDRVHRIGQTKNVMVYRLVSAGTIEEKVMDLKDSKAALFDAVVDEGRFFSSQLTASEIRDLLVPG